MRRRVCQTTWIVEATANRDHISRCQLAAKTAHHDMSISSEDRRTMTYQDLES